MSARAFIEQLGSVGPDRMLSLTNDGTVSTFFVLVGPDFDAEGKPRPSPANRAHWFDVDEISPAFVRRYAWWVATPDQAADVARLTELDSKLNPSGFCLNIEKALQGVSLKPLISGVKALGKPIVASLAGTSASHTMYDYRTLDLAGVQIDWQAYLDSGEGQPPDYSVAELYQSSFVIGGWEYRCRIGKTYGWGKVREIQNEWKAWYDSYKRPPIKDGWFYVKPRFWGFPPQVWGYTVDGRTLYRASNPIGLLMGRASYSRIAVTLDVTRTAQAQRDLAGWEALAASARIKGAAKRPCSIYLLDNCPDDVARAIAKGAA